MSKPPVVDPTCVVGNIAFVRDFDNPLQAVRAAYNAAAERMTIMQREPAMIEVTIRATPKPQE